MAADTSMEDASATNDITTWFKKETIPRNQTHVPWTTLHSNVVVGVDDQVRSLRSWVRDFLHRVPGTPKGAFLIGPAGTGKTVVAEMALRERGLNIVERNASSHRTRKAFEDDVHNTVKSGLPNALLFEDTDSMASGQGGLDYVCRLVNPLRGTTKPITRKDRERVAAQWTIPVVCIANTASTRALTDLMSDTLVIRFGEVSQKAMEDIASVILSKEGKSVDPGVIERIASNCRGDARQFVTSLEYAFRTDGIPSVADKSYAPVAVADLVFSSASMTMSEAMEISSSDPISVAHCLQENYLTREDADPDAILEIADAFSNVDLMVSDETAFTTYYVPGIAACVVRSRLSPCRGPDMNPGTSWSRKSYEAMRQKQLQKARDALGGRMCPESVAGVAYAIRAYAKSNDYKGISRLAVAYGLDHKGIDVVVRAVSAEPLKQRHKTALKALFLPS